MSFLSGCPISNIGLLMTLLTCLALILARRFQYARQISRRQRLIAQDLATDPRRIRHNLRRSSSSCA